MQYGKMKIHPVASNVGSDWLRSAATNTNSQAGQDGYLRRIFEIMPPANKWCVEFGAWDGKYLSNTWSLINDHGWSGVLIEGDKERSQALAENYKGNDRAHCISTFVGFERGVDTLDDILSRTPCPKDLDFISIDVDGNDWHIWNSMKDYRPRFVNIEFNPTAGNDVSFVQDQNFSLSHGTSLRSMIELGKSKGYELIGVVQDACFVREEDFHLFNIEDNSIENMFSTGVETTIAQGFDGSIIIGGYDELGWKNSAKFTEADVQVLPISMQKLWGLT